MKIPNSLWLIPSIRRTCRRRSTGSLTILPVSTSPFHSATHGPSIPQEDALPGTLHGKLHQLKEPTPAAATPKPKSTFVDTMALIAGWGVVFLGLGVSLHGSRSMISGHQELVRRKSEGVSILEGLPVVEIRRWSGRGSSEL